MRIAIDPNVRTEGNRTYAGFGDLFGDVDELHAGDYALAMGEETDVVFDAKVHEINHDRRLIYLIVDWQSGRSDRYDELT